MKVKPLADRVLVKTEKTESKTASGIIFRIQRRKKHKLQLFLQSAMIKKRLR